MLSKVFKAFSISAYLFISFDQGPVHSQEFDSNHLFIFEKQHREMGCMSYFNPTSNSDNLINAYFLAKFSEAMYPERLDLQIRMQQNGGRVPSNLKSTDEFKIHPTVTDKNFESAFVARYAHYFKRTNDADSTTWRFLEKAALDTIGIFNRRIVHGQDPECMIISTANYVLILFRGTDDIKNNRFAEWIGTDFNAFKTKTDSVFGSSRVHKGFYKSFKLIENDLVRALEEIKAGSKPVWIAGHSLGGAMAVIAGLYLKENNFQIGGICSFGGPSVIGNKTFSSLLEEQLPDKIQRYEFSLDPVSILKAPGYKTFGTRNWIYRDSICHYQLYIDCPERTFMPVGKKYDVASNRHMRFTLFSSRLSKLPYALFHHNTQWIVKGLYSSLNAIDRSKLPSPEDTFPFIYYAWELGK